MISIFIFSVVSMYLFFNQGKMFNWKSEQPAPVPGNEDISSVFVVMSPCISIMGNCFRICFPHGIRLANIIIITLHFGDRIFREFPRRALTWLQNQPYTADWNHQEPGVRILPVATQSSGQYRKIESAPEANTSALWPWLLLDWFSFFPGWLPPSPKGS